MTDIANVHRPAWSEQSRSRESECCTTVNSKTWSIIPQNCQRPLRENCCQISAFASAQEIKAKEDASVRLGSLFRFESYEMYRPDTPELSIKHGRSAQCYMAKKVEIFGNRFFLVGLNSICAEHLLFRGNRPNCMSFLTARQSLRGRVPGACLRWRKGTRCACIRGSMKLSSTVGQ